MFVVWTEMPGEIDEQQYPFHGMGGGRGFSVLAQSTWYDRQ
jgi:hypothetical protein